MYGSFGVSGFEDGVSGRKAIWEGSQVSGKGVTGASTLLCIKELSRGSQQKIPQPKRLWLSAPAQLLRKPLRLAFVGGSLALSERL